MLIKPKYIIGIDEAGRGPLAGPVSVGVAMVPTDFDWNQIPGVNDSKKLTEKKREEIFKITKKLKKEGKLQYAVSMTGAKSIDTDGIITAINRSMLRALKRVAEVNPPKARPRQGCGGLALGGSITTVNRSMGRFAYEDVSVKLDGGLTAPQEFMNQETIIKGDSKEKVIGLASILAKVMRDRYMVRKSALPIFEPYTFAQHKGYGTKAHREAIAQHGLSNEHRKTFCKNIQVL